MDYPTADEPVRNDLLKSSDRLKQEIKCSRIYDFIMILYTVTKICMVKYHVGKEGSYIG